MENPFTYPLTWKAFAAYVLATFIANLITGSGLAALLTLYLNRKRPAVEIHLSEAQAELAFAQADEARIRTRKTAKDLIDEMTISISELEGKLRHKDDQIHALEEQIEMIKAGRVFDRNESAG